MDLYVTSSGVFSASIAPSLLPPDPPLELPGISRLVAASRLRDLSLSTLLLSTSKMPEQGENGGRSGDEKGAKKEGGQQVGGGSPPASSPPPPPPPGRSPALSTLIYYAKLRRNGLSSTLANVVGVSLVFPLDTIKTHVQTAPQALGGINCARQIFRKEGILGFYRGGLMTVITASAVRSIGFTSYNLIQNTLSKGIAGFGYPEPIAVARTPGALPTLLTIANFGTAGFLTGCLQATLACPFELTKIAAQLSAKPSSGLAAAGGKGSVAMAKEIHARFGPGGFYFGFSRHLARDAIGTTVYFAAYESIKQTVNTKRGEAPNSQFGVAVAGGSCGVCGWVITYPLDRLKTKFQEARLNAKRGERVTIGRVDLLTREAWGGFHLSVVRSAVLSAIIFSVLEKVKSAIERLED